MLLFGGSRRSCVIASIAAVLYLPAPFTDATGIFSKFRPRSVISVLESIQEFVDVVMNRPTPAHGPTIAEMAGTFHEGVEWFVAKRKPQWTGE